MSPQGLPLEVTDTAIILEGVIAMDGLENVPHSIFVFGLIYALNMEYLSQQFVQCVFNSRKKPVLGLFLHFGCCFQIDG